MKGLAANPTLSPKSFFWLAWVELTWEEFDWVRTGCMTRLESMIIGSPRTKFPECPLVLRYGARSAKETRSLSRHPHIFIHSIFFILAPSLFVCVRCLRLASLQTKNIAIYMISPAWDLFTSARGVPEEQYVTLILYLAQGTHVAAILIPQLHK